MSAAQSTTSTEPDPLPTAPGAAADRWPEDGHGNEGALLHERVRLHLANQWVLVAGNATTSAVTAAMLWAVVDRSRLLGWLALLASALALRIAVHRWSRRSPPIEDATGRVRLRWLRGAVLATGAAWGAAALLVMPQQDLRLQLFLVFILASMALGSLTLNAFDLPAAAGFAALTLVPLALRLLAQDHAAMAAMVLLFLGLMALTGRSVQRAVRDQVVARAHEAQRAAALMREQQRQQQLADALAQKTEALQITLDSMDQGILSLGSDGRTNFFNRRLSALVDLPEEFLASRPTMEQVASYQLQHGHYGDDLGLLDEPSRAALKRWLAGDRSPFPANYLRRKPDGTTLEVKTRYLPGGALVRTFADVTAYFDALRQLQDSQVQTRKLALVAAHTDNAVAISDARQRIEWVNEGFTRLTGYASSEMAGRRVSELLHGPGTEPGQLARTDEQLLRDRHWSGEVLQQTKDGRRYWFGVDVQAIVDADGQVHQYIAIGRDVTARHAAEQALQDARDEAERASRAKSEFLSAMSHELRTPMNAILGFAQLLQRQATPRLTESERGYVEQILRAGSHLLDLISDVLDLARVESGRQPMHIEPAAPSAIVDECMALLSPLAAQHGVRLDRTGPPANEAWVAADRTRLKQVLINLLSNAIKYNRAGGCVRVACESRGDVLCIEVSDTGPGLTVQQQAQLFTAFERLGAERGPVQGAGIGLALSRQLVELMGGSIDVDSEPGRGTTVRLELRRVPAPLSATAPAPQAAPAAAEATPDHAPAGAVPRTVLHIEDNPVNLILVEAMLAHEPAVRLVSAALPETGLDLARAEKPDLVLLDIQLPGMDGFEVLRRLRSDDATSRTPVVAVSANAMPADVERALAAGFDAYLTKPLDLGVLLATVRRRWPALESTAS